MDAHGSSTVGKKGNCVTDSRRNQRNIIRRNKNIQVFHHIAIVQPQNVTNCFLLPARKQANSKPVAVSLLFIKYIWKVTKLYQLKAIMVSIIYPVSQFFTLNLIPLLCKTVLQHNVAKVLNLPPLRNELTIHAHRHWLPSRRIQTSQRHVPEQNCPSSNLLTFQTIPVNKLTIT
jgi:hypothetical protein